MGVRCSHGSIVRMATRIIRPIIRMVIRRKKKKKMYFTLLVKKKKRKKEKKNKKKKRKSEKFFSFRQTFEVAFPFRISLSYSRSSTQLKTEFHMKFPESNKGRSHNSAWIECLSRKSSTLNIPTILFIEKEKEEKNDLINCLTNCNLTQHDIIHEILDEKDR